RTAHSKPGSPVMAGGLTPYLKRARPTLRVTAYYMIKAAIVTKPGYTTVGDIETPSENGGEGKI
ncbi:MAG: hypothetical protein RLZZ435_479, partial [Cyanobacteriota bacterium]